MTLKSIDDSILLSPTRQENKMRQFINIVILIFLASCDTSHNWEYFPSKGLPQEHESYNDMIFADSLTGYLGGDRMISPGEVNDQYQFTNRTVLYRTQDQGKSWLKIPFDYKGSVGKIFPFGDTLVVLLQDVTSDSVYILKSQNKGKDWGKLFSTSRDVHIREIQFTHADNGFIVTDDGSKSFLLRLQSNKCDTIVNLPYDHYNYKIIHQKLFALITERATANSTGVLITDIVTGKNNEQPFDKPYFITSSTSSEKYLYLAVSNKNTGKILRVSDREIKAYDLAEYSDYHLDHVFVYGKTIMAIANRQEDVAFLGVIHNLLISKDNGLTWTLEEIPDPLYIKPATIYKDKFFITYCGAGSIQIRKWY